MFKFTLMIAVFISNVISVQAGDIYTIDPSHTYPYFRINHLGFSTLNGRFNSTKGTIEMDLSAKTASVNIVIDAASVDTAWAKRDKHLRSPDFLNVVEFPKITFKSTQVTFNGKSKATVIGDLTIMGVTKSTTLNVTNIKCGKHPFNKKQVCGFNATSDIKRSDFGIKYGLPAIGDEMQFTFEVEGVKN